MQFSINAAKGAQISVQEKKESKEISLIEISVKHEEFRQPERSTISFEVPCFQTAGTFSPGVDFDRSVNAGWKAGGVRSRFVSGMPLYCAYSSEGMNDFTIVASDGNTPLEIIPMVNEDSGCMRIYVHLFTDVSPAFLEYRIVLRIDRRRNPFYEAVEEASQWQRSFVPKRAYPVADSAWDPVYSTWYGFHRTINEKDVLEECKRMVKRGVKTLILDDGWYSDDPNPQFYFCGDWSPAKGKFPDMKRFVEEVHHLGMKVMVWFSVPYLGTKSKLYERFSKMQIRNESNWNCLDFRFSEVREYLLEVYTEFAKTYGIDGMKLDFIDALYGEKGFEKPSKEHDCVSLEEGMEKFLSALIPALKEINPEFMTEFRQYYIGNDITRFADMVRVNDCPYDALRNRTAILGLRMTCPKVPIHSDMIRWNRETKVEDAALQIVSSLFSVLQISVREDDLTEETRKMLEFYLNFAEREKELLLKGKLRLKKPEMNYTEASVEDETEQIKVLYAPCVCSIGRFPTETIINASGEENIAFLPAAGERSYQIYDCMGNLCGNGKLQAHTQAVMLTAPKCGMLRLKEI